MSPSKQASELVKPPSRQEFVEGALASLEAAYDLPVSAYADTTERLGPSIYEKAWLTYSPADHMVKPNHLPTLLTYLDTYLTAQRELHNPIAQSVSSELTRKIMSKLWPLKPVNVSRIVIKRLGSAID